MRGSRDGDDINILSLDHSAKIRITALVIGLADPPHIALCQFIDAKARALKAFRELTEGSGAASADADQRRSERLARRRLPFGAECVARQNCKGDASDKRFFDEAATSDSMYAFHDACSVWIAFNLTN